MYLRRVCGVVVCAVCCGYHSAAFINMGVHLFAIVRRVTYGDASLADTYNSCSERSGALQPRPGVKFDSPNKKSPATEPG